MKEQGNFRRRSGDNSVNRRGAAYGIVYNLQSDLEITTREREWAVQAALEAQHDIKILREELTRLKAKLDLERAWSKQLADSNQILMKRCEVLERLQTRGRDKRFRRF